MSPGQSAALSICAANVLSWETGEWGRGVGGGGDRVVATFLTVAGFMFCGLTDPGDTVSIILYIWRFGGLEAVCACSAPLVAQCFGEVY